jgi:hypothetical protein
MVSDLVGKELSQQRFKKIRGEHTLQWQSANPATTDAFKENLGAVLGAGNYRHEFVAMDGETVVQAGERGKDVYDRLVIEGENNLKKVVAAGGAFENSMEYEDLSRLRPTTLNR